MHLELLGPVPQVKEGGLAVGAYPGDAARHREPLACTVVTGAAGLAPLEVGRRLLIGVGPSKAWGIGVYVLLSKPEKLLLPRPVELLSAFWHLSSALRSRPKPQ